MTPTYPDACIQSLTGDWWEKTSDKNVARGSLLKVIVEYPDMKPYRLIPVGRGEDPRQHATANYRIEEFCTGDPMRVESALPVAGLPLRSGESYMVRRGKTRPVVVLAAAGPEVEDRLRRGGAKWQYGQTLLVAPYYGAEADGTRAGWKPEFVSRIQCAEYSQYVWDMLPIGGSVDGSILRLDHIFPLGADAANWTPTGFRLSSDGLECFDEWLCWHITGTLPEGGVLAYARAELPKLKSS